MRLHHVSADIASWRIIDDEAVVVHVETSDYFGLNQSGTWLWARLAERAHSADELASLLSVRYGLANEIATRDVGAFLGHLFAAHLLRDGVLEEATPQGASFGDEPSCPSGAGERIDGEIPLDPYEPPEITRFGDLETLILSGE